MRYRNSRRMFLSCEEHKNVLSMGRPVGQTSYACVKIYWLGYDRIILLDARVVLFVQGSSDVPVGRSAFYGEDLA